MKIRSLMAATALLLAGPALAQVEAEEVGRNLDNRPWEEKVGVDLKGGFGNLTGDMGDETGTAPLAGIEAEAQVHPIVGIEVGYEGQRFPIQDIRVGDGEGLWRHNVSAMAKAGPLLMGHLRPFVGAGVGLTYINPSAVADNLYENDLLEEIPLAAGLDYDFGDITAGARASYSFWLGEGFADEAFPDDNSANLFNATFTLGGRF